VPDDEYLVKTYLPAFTVIFGGGLAYFAVSAVLIVAEEGIAGLAGVSPLGPLLFGAFMAATIAQHRSPVRISANGIRQRTTSHLHYDTVVPWSQVTRMWFGRFGLFPAVFMTLRDPEAIAGSNDGLRAQIRMYRARNQADLAILLPFNLSPKAAVAGAISLHSGGRIIVENSTSADRLR
jgi:hypothetical protein